MKVVGLNGRDYNLNTKKYGEQTSTDNKSSLHLNARKLIKSIYPSDRLLEEVCIPGTVLYIDFFIPSLPKAIEVHGRQHFEFVKHFHQDKFGFALSKTRDSQKQQWCEINSIPLIVLRFDESQEIWSKKILSMNSVLK